MTETKVSWVVQYQIDLQWKDWFRYTSEEGGRTDFSRRIWNISPGSDWRLVKETLIVEEVASAALVKK